MSIKSHWEHAALPADLRGATLSNSIDGPEWITCGSRRVDQKHVTGWVDQKRDTSEGGEREIHEGQLVIRPSLSRHPSRQDSLNSQKTMLAEVFNKNINPKLIQTPMKLMLPFDCSTVAIVWIRGNKRTTLMCVRRTQHHHQSKKKRVTWNPGN